MSQVADKWTLRIAALGVTAIGIAGMALGKDGVLLAGVVGVLGFILGKQI
jgi:hypothetical protein